MINVSLKADCQKLTVEKRPETIISGTKGMIRLKFRVSQDWIGFRMVADFGTEAVPLVGNACIVPDSVTDGDDITVRLVGARDGKRLVTGTVSIKQKRW